MRKPLLAAGLAALLAYAATAQPQEYPVRPIRVVVPYAPGGGNDVIVRMIAPRLSERLGQSIVVDNRAGGAAMIGTEIVARAQRDGYVLLMTDNVHVITPAIYSKVPYDPIRDFDPVAVVASTPLMIVSHPGVSAPSLRDFVELAKSQPGRIVVAYGGPPAQMLAELFRLRSGAELNLVPYKGTGPALTDVMAGHVHSTVTSMPSAIPLMKAGRVRGLGVASRKRAMAAPDVPTFIETGIGEIVAENWYGILAPAGVPPAIRAKLEREIIAVARSPQMRERFLASALEPTTMTGAEFRTVLRTDLEKWVAVVKAANLKIQ